MDVNYILTREQIERSLARAATDPAARAAHQDLADRYRGQVDAYRHDNGAPIRLTSAASPAAARPQAA